MAADPTFDDNLQIQTFALGCLAANSYLVSATSKNGKTNAVVIDPRRDVEGISIHLW